MAVRLGILFLALAAVLVPVACGQSNGVRMRGLAAPPPTDVEAEHNQIAGSSAMSQENLAEALAEIRELPVPDEVEPELFERLKSALEEALVQRFSEHHSVSQSGTAEGARANVSADAAANSASSPTAGQSSEAWYLQAMTNAQSEVLLSWRGRHVGDYNLDGVVSIADITPLAIYFGATPSVDDEGLPLVLGNNEFIANVDGNGDGVVSIADITPLAANFGSSLVGYRVYVGISGAEGSIVWNEDFLPNQSNPDSPVTVQFNSSRAAGEVQQYAYAFPPELAEGEAVHVRIVPYDGVDERAASEIPIYAGEPHSQFYCGVCHKSGSSQFRGVEGSCLLCHSSPPEDVESEWASAPGAHQLCLLCHDAHGFTISPPESACSLCHSGMVSDLAGTGMEACLGCHQAPHLPDPNPSPAACPTCHGDVSAELADGSMQDCSLCHRAHEFSLEYTPALCISCHPTPPENPATSWQDAPGQHSVCSSCHQPHNFRLSLGTISQTCHQCHQDVPWNESHPCVNCHQNPHLPLYW